MAVSLGFSLCTSIGWSHFRFRVRGSAFGGRRFSPLDGVEGGRIFEGEFAAFAFAWLISELLLLGAIL